jgi:hypothetical protein
MELLEGPADAISLETFKTFCVKYIYENAEQQVISYVSYTSQLLTFSLQ